MKHKRILEKKRNQKKAMKVLEEAILKNDLAMVNNTLTYNLQNIVRLEVINVLKQQAQATLNNLY